MSTRINDAFGLMRRLIHPFPCNGSEDVLSCRPFFILSTGRSGSTLLRAILMEDPSVCIPPESHVLAQVVASFRRYYRFLPWTYVVRLVVAEFASAPGHPVPGFVHWKLDLTEFYVRAYALPKNERRLDRLIDLFYIYYKDHKKRQAVRWGDKSLENGNAFPELLSLFPQAQFIHLVRDGRDVVASLLEHRISKDLEKACRYWQHTNMRVRQLGQTLQDQQFLTVHYHELVSDPEKSVRRLCDFLGMNYTPRLLQFWQHSDTLGDTDRSLHARLKKPIDDKAIGRWREKLDAEQQELVDRLLDDTLKTFGYLP